MSLIEVIDLHQRFGTKDVLKDVSLTVERGEILAVIGPTGSGKTTLLRLIDQLDQPASGKILFDGQEVTPRLRTDVRRRISMVLQKPVVFDASVFDNVAYPLKVRKYERKTIPDRVNAMLKTVGLDGYQKRKARTLSGGETQKVALARALITDPQVLLLDEPTANLDPVSLNTIEDLILRFNRDNGMAIVIATHEMAQGQRLAHRIGVMMQGELIQVGQPEDIFYAPSDLRVARFVGVENILKGSIASNDSGLAHISVNGHSLEAVTHLGTGEEVYVFVRPEEITISMETSPSSARNTFSGEVKAAGIVRASRQGGNQLRAHPRGAHHQEVSRGAGIRLGQQVHVSFKASAVHVISRAGSDQSEPPGPTVESSATTMEPRDIIPPDPSRFFPS